MTGTTGTIAILLNDAMPGFSRVEYAVKGDISNKIRQINSAPLPVPFRLFFAAKVGNLKLAKRNFLYLFADHRDGDDAAFFTANPDELRVAIEMAAIETIELTDEQQGITKVARAKMNQLKARHDEVYFKSQLPQPGTSMCFSKDRSITCQSLGNGMVHYEGAKLTPGAAAAQALQKLGFDWTNSHGAGYWVPHIATADATSKNPAEPAFSGEDTMPEIPVVLDDADDSPIMLIRNSK